MSEAVRQLPQRRHGDESAFRRHQRRHGIWATGREGHINRGVGSPDSSEATAKPN